MGERSKCWVAEAHTYLSELREEIQHWPWLRSPCDSSGSRRRFGFPRGKINSNVWGRREAPVQWLVRYSFRDYQDFWKWKCISLPEFFLKRQHRPIFLPCEGLSKHLIWKVQQVSSDWESCQHPPPPWVIQAFITPTDPSLTPASPTTEMVVNSRLDVCWILSSSTETKSFRNHWDQAS